MSISEKIQSEVTAYFLAALLVFILMGRYGRQAAEWLLMKLYEIFIGRSPMGS